MAHPFTDEVSNYIPDGKCPDCGGQAFTLTLEPKVYNVYMGCLEAEEDPNSGFGTQQIECVNCHRKFL